METAESSRLDEFAWMIRIQMILTKCKKFGMDVKILRNVKRFWVRPACMAGVLT